MLEDYKGNKPELYKRYIDDVLRASSGARQDLEDFIEFCSAYHLSLKYTFEMSESSVSFLDLCLSIPDARIATPIHYNPSDTHSYFYYCSSHPPHCKKAIPCSQFLRFRRICSDDDECSLCNRYKLYIGETGRRLANRFGEHLRAVEGFEQRGGGGGVEFPLPKTLI